MSTPWTTHHTLLVAQCLRPAVPVARWTRQTAPTWDATWMGLQIAIYTYWRGWVAQSGLDP